MKRKIPCLLLLMLLNAPCPALANSPAPLPRPKLSMQDAVKAASLFAGKEVKLEDYYMDRVWIGELPEETERKWIVSWCPADPESVTTGWYILVVDMQGVVSHPKKGVRWLGPGNYGQ